MKFVDEIRIRVKGGDGGDGSVAFRRETHMPFGGPSGGDGGQGGSVIFIADEGRRSLLELVHLPVLRAKRGEHGRGKDQYGKRGADLEVKVPVGTEVFDDEMGGLLADMTEHGARAVVARGGRGGRGNIHFSTPFDRAPRRAEPGTAGEERSLRLELKVLADVGLLGFPNVGKSTLVRAMSRARPRVADYPFTTLQPHLGVVAIGGRASDATFVVADIPGLIPGASQGAGLGTRFLKHVERCGALLHLVAPPTDMLREEGRDPLADFDALMKELTAFAPELATRPMIVAMSKADLVDSSETFTALRRRFAARRIDLHAVSALTRQGVDRLALELFRLVRRRDLEEYEVDQGTPDDARVVVDRSDRSDRPDQADGADLRAPPQATYAAAPASPPVSIFAIARPTPRPSTKKRAAAEPPPKTKKAPPAKRAANAAPKSRAKPASERSAGTTRPKAKRAQPKQAGAKPATKTKKPTGAKKSTRGGPKRPKRSAR